MAVIEGGVSGALAGVGAESASGIHVHQAAWPYGAGGVYAAGATTGTIAAGLAANSEIFQFRYVTAASRICLVHRVVVSAGLNVAATAAGLVSLRLTAARSWTVAGSGGTRLTLSGDNCNLRTSVAASEVNDAGISTTAALTVGTKTLDTTDLATIATGIGTGALTVAADLPIFAPTALWDQNSNFHPIVLANQEGFVVRTGAAMPATMTWHACVSIVWSEVPSY
jgi:hypothetical protein